MNFDRRLHIEGKVYDLTQENMNAMLDAVEFLREESGLLYTINHHQEVLIGKLKQKLGDAEKLVAVLEKCVGAFDNEFGESICGEALPELKSAIKEYRGES